MKPSDLSFVALYAAWQDGALPENEQPAFEAECKRRGITLGQIEADRLAARQLGGLLRRHAETAVPAALRNADFFNAELLRRIEAETPSPEAPQKVLFFPPLRRLLWGGFASLGAAALLFAALVFPALNRTGPPPEYYAQVLRTNDPSISAVAMRPKNENVTVLWIDGLNYVPANNTKN
jgi:hypothetical protein